MFNLREDILAHVRKGDKVQNAGAGAEGQMIDTEVRCTRRWGLRHQTRHPRHRRLPRI